MQSFCVLTLVPFRLQLINYSNKIRLPAQGHIHDKHLFHSVQQLCCRPLNNSQQLLMNTHSGNTGSSVCPSRGAVAQPGPLQDK